jgi:LPXTG-site transpeptidase (sortase) family protein
MPYYYYKAKTVTTPVRFGLAKRIKHNLIRIIPNVLIILGGTALITVSAPMFSYYQKSKNWQANNLVTPIPENEWDVARGMAKVNREVVRDDDPASPVIAYQDKPEVVEDIDYTKAENWFQDPSFKPQKYQAYINAPSVYTISIPDVDVEDMKVEIGGENLDQHLIHYAGTSMPGEYGNPVIFGHSVLPVFYNPESYLSVFSKIPTLDKGDEIFVNYDGIKYKYLVDSYHEVQPNQVELLEQRYDRKTLTLVTCVPPGTYLRRGVILARLEEYTPETSR